MSEKRRLVSAAVWLVGAGSLGRVIGLVGTLVLTRYLSPDIVAEVTVAAVIAFTGNWIGAWGCGQYVMIRGGEGHEAVFAATVVHLLLGSVALGLLWALAPWIGTLLATPELASYLPGTLLAVAIRRLGAIPDKLLARDLRFSRIATAAGLGDVAYALTAVGLVATTQLRGHAMIVAFVVQSCVIASITITGVPVRSWLRPVPLGLDRIRNLLRFGAPVTAEITLSEGARYWDKPLMLKLLGADAAGTYGLAFNLAHLPAIYIGGHIGTVMLPAIVRANDVDRGSLVGRAFVLTAVVLFPMAFGLAACAGTLVAALLPAEWAQVGPLLSVLASTSVLAPASFLLASFLAALGANTALMRIELASVLTLLLLLAILSQWGVVVASFAIGAALTAQLVLSLVACRHRGLRLEGVAAPLARVVLACATMVMAVVATRVLLQAQMAEVSWILLLAEIGVGALVYVAMMFATSRSLLHDVARLLGPSRVARESPAIAAGPVAP